MENVARPRLSRGLVACAVFASLSFGSVAGAQDTLMLKSQTVKEQKEARRQQERIQSVRARGTGESQRARSPGSIGSVYGNRELPQGCVDARATAAQLVAGSRAETQFNDGGVTTAGHISSVLGRMDASQGVVAGPFESQAGRRRPGESAFEAPTRAMTTKSRAYGCNPLDR